MVNFTADRYGRDNIVSAWTHFDEVRNREGIEKENGKSLIPLKEREHCQDHIHIRYVPRTEDGRISTKEVTPRKELRDYQREMQQHLREKFPEKEELFPEYLRFTESTSQDIIQALGTTAVLDAIDEYNELAKNKANESLEKYKEDRKNITPEVHDKFVSTIALINNFYKGDKKFEDYDDRLKTEESIQRFLQSSTVEEQLEAAGTVWKLLPSRAIQRENTTIEGETISMRDIVTNALRKRTATEHVMSCDKVEAQTKDTMQREGDTIDDK